MEQLAAQFIELRTAARGFQRRADESAKRSSQLKKQMQEAQARGDSLSAENCARAALSAEATSREMAALGLRMSDASTRLDALIHARVSAAAIARITQSVVSIKGMNDPRAVSDAMVQFEALLAGLGQSAGALGSALASPAEDSAVRALLEQGQAAVDLSSKISLPSVPGGATEASAEDQDLERRWQKLRS